MSEKSRKGVLKLIGLSLGVTASQLALIVIGMSDSVMMGRVSRRGLAAGTLVSSFYNLGLLFCMGMIIPIAVQIGNSKFRDTEEKRTAITVAYYRISLITSLLTILFLFITVKINLSVGKDTEMLRIAERYAIGIMPGIIPWVMFYLIRNILLCYQRVKLTTILACISVILNILLNRVFIYGFGIFHVFGIEGCAIATSLTNWIIFLTAFCVLRKDRSIIPELRKIVKSDRRYIGPTIKLGIPTGLVFFSEYLIFSFGNSLLSSMSTTAVVAFGIAVSWLNLMYMFPVALSQVITEPISRYFAMGNMDKVRELSKTVLATLFLYNAACIGVILLCKKWMIHFIVADNMTPSLFKLSEKYMYLMAIVIFLYNFIVVLGGILRGFGDVKTPLVMMFVMYWGVGIGGTILFTHFTGVYGVLLGMCFGFFLTYLGIFSSYLKKMRRT